MQAKLKDFVYNMDNVPIKIKTVACEEGLDVVHITVPVQDQDTSLDFLDCFREFIAVDGFADNGDGLMLPDTNTTVNNNNDDTANTTFENISMYNNTLVLEHPPKNNTTLSEWDVISSGNSPEKFHKTVTDNTDSTIKQHLSDIKEEKSSSGISSSSSSSCFRSPRPTVSPSTTYSREWGLPELKITDRFVAGIVQDVVDPAKFVVSSFDLFFINNLFLFLKNLLMKY